MREAVLYKNRSNGSVQCTCCQHKCLISPDHYGICGVRKNIDGKLFLMVYGKAAAFNIDPIEKKPFFHFLPGTSAFSFGTFGCNFRCSFCQNWDISQIRNIGEEGRDLPPEEIVNYCVSNKIPTIAYTYNEPTIFTEYARDTAVLAKKKGIKNVYVSNGYESIECLKFMKDWCDAINIDIKSFNEDFYRKVCGGSLKGVLETVARAKEMGIWVECTTLVIPGENDSSAELAAIVKFIAGISDEIPWHVTAFHPDYKMLDHNTTREETLEKAWKIGRDAGLKYVYTGNISSGHGHENTICPKCGEILVKREGMGCLENKIAWNGKCFKCGEKIDGVWK